MGRRWSCSSISARASPPRDLRDVLALKVARQRTPGIVRADREIGRRRLLYAGSSLSKFPRPLTATGSGSPNTVTLGIIEPGAVKNGYGRPSVAFFKSLMCFTFVSDCGFPLSTTVLLAASSSRNLRREQGRAIVAPPADQSRGKPARIPASPCRSLSVVRQPQSL
jgi:hypothetical protein